MSHCDFSEEVEDAIDQGHPYDDEEASKQDAPQLLWLSDIPLFQSIKAMKPGGHSYLTEEDNDTELQCTYQSSRVAYRDETGVYSQKSAEKSKKALPVTNYDSNNDFDDDDDEWADTNIVKRPVERDENGNIIRYLENTPDWYERYSSFLCQKKPEVILTTLKNMLENDDRIEVNIPDQKYQIRGSVNLQEKHMMFHINIFKDTIDGEYLVEFQRQSGCMLDFQAIYRQSLAHLNQMKDMLIAPINAKSTGIFNFMPIEKLIILTKDVDGKESKEVMTKVTLSDDQLKKLTDDQLKNMMSALEECEKRFVSRLVEVRNEALCNLLVASSEIKTIVYKDADNIISVLSSAMKKLSNPSSRINKEMARCIANITYNICDKSKFSEEDQKTLDTLLHRVATEIVPLLLTFWQPSDKECIPRRKETDKQIVQLLALLYPSNKYKLAPESIDLIKKKLDLIHRKKGYENMHTSLTTVYAAFRPSLLVTYILIILIYVFFLFNLFLFHDDITKLYDLNYFL